MDNYDSLAEQMKEDFHSNMLALSGMAKSVTDVRAATVKSYRTIRRILRAHKTLEARVTVLEAWKAEVQATAS